MATKKDLHEEIKADTHAARVRDYGEADAATYEQRVKDGSAMMQSGDKQQEAAMPAEDWAEFGRMMRDVADPKSAYDKALDASAERGSISNDKDISRGR